MEATVLVCDWAEVKEQKLYIMGAGWDVVETNGGTLDLAIAVLLRIEWTETNTPHDIEIALRDADGHVVNQSDMDVAIRGKVETGRPAGSTHGKSIPVPIAFTAKQLQLPPDTTYRVEVRVDDETLAHYSFEVRN